MVHTVRGRRAVSRGLTALGLVLVACTSGGDPSPSTPPQQTTPSPAVTATAPPSPLPYATPEWFKEGVLYEVFVRSFADSDGDGIGDLQGIAGRLDYIQSLGVTAIWLTPIFASPSYHGYDTTDYYEINPDFGTLEDLQSLVDQAHQRGMRIILDFVASHTSNLHPNFVDAFENPASEFSEWYLWHDEAHHTYQTFFGVQSLPSLNHASEAVNRYFVDLAMHWMDLDGDGDYSDGVDGFRCDYALGSPHAFWEELRASLKPLNPDVLLLGEVWVDGPNAQEPYLEDQFDALFDFPVYIQLQANPAIPGDGAINGGTFLSSLNNAIREQGSFPPESILVRFAGNHDTDRIATEVEVNPDRQRQAAMVVATLSGTPMIYYGDEIGMTGHKGPGPVYDEYRREPMDWYAGAVGADQTTWFADARFTDPHDGISVEEQEVAPSSLLNFYRDLYVLRMSNPALAHGDLTLLPVSPDEGVWAFWRHADGQVVSAIFNFNAEEVTVGLDLDTAPGALADTPVNLLLASPQPLDAQALTLGPAQSLLLDWTPA